jgi:hypothetical protein
MRSVRSLAIATAVVFCVSTIFPVVASLVRDAGSLPRIVGVMDGVIAFTLVGMAMILWSRTRGKVTKDAEAAAYSGYRVLLHVIIVLLVLFFLVGDRIAWTIGLVGISWRSWLLLYTLPAWFAALRAAEESNHPPGQAIPRP